MLRIACTALATAGVCFTITATTGLAAGVAKVFNLKVGDIASFSADNFHCQAVTRTQVACGAKVAPGSVQVYYAPHQLEVVKFGKTLKQGTVLLNVRR
jgi:hypothetical protein